MFDLEKAIKIWKKDFYKIPSLEDGYIEELEGHLREEISQSLEEGLSEKSAFQKAVDDVGPADKIGVEYFKTDTRGLSATPPWKRRPTTGERRHW